MQPQVIMGSGLVDLSRDSGWDGATRCITTVGWMGPDSDQGNSLEDHVSFILFSNTRQCEDIKGDNDSCG